jgi:hypothetical protein
MELENLAEINNQGGKLIVTLEELKDIYIYESRPSAKCVMIRKKAFITFESLKNIQFIVEAFTNKNNLAFIENCDVVESYLYDKNFFEFLIKEFWQGKTVGLKFIRLLQIILLLFSFNFLIFSFSSERNISNFCSAILTGISFFIAIFSVFTVNQSHFEKAKITLFKSGKTPYYFSVDRNMTYAGFVVIIFALLGLLITNDTSLPFVEINKLDLRLSKFITRKFLLLFLINTCFLLSYITLRSLVEFYLKRPAAYILGDLKDEYLKS